MKYKCLMCKQDEMKLSQCNMVFIHWAVVSIIAGHIFYESHCWETVLCWQQALKLINNLHKKLWFSKRWNAPFFISINVSSCLKSLVRQTNFHRENLLFSWQLSKKKKTIWETCVSTGMLIFSWRAYLNWKSDWVTALIRLIRLYLD